MKNYYCVVCKYLGCENAGKGDIALQEFNRKFFVRLPAAEFTVIHGECGLEFTYSPCDVYRKDLAQMQEFSPYPNFARLPSGEVGATLENAAPWSRK
jgi:hypothetical protein